MKIPYFNLSARTFKVTRDCCFPTYGLGKCYVSMSSPVNHLQPLSLRLPLPLTTVGTCLVTPLLPQLLVSLQFLIFSNTNTFLFYII